VLEELPVLASARSSNFTRRSLLRSELYRATSFLSTGDSYGVSAPPPSSCFYRRPRPERNCATPGALCVRPAVIENEGNEFLSLERRTNPHFVRSGYFCPEASLDSPVTGDCRLPP
jgi:hypothetical protein